MSKSEYPKCPYCGKKTGFLKIGSIMVKSDYECEMCKNVSSVKVKHEVLGFVFVMLLFMIVFLALSIIFNKLSSFEVYVLFGVCVATCVLLPHHIELVKCSSGDAKEKTKIEETKE